MQIHTEYSYDGYVSLHDLDRICRRRKITAVAITDHNEIEGALEAERLNRKGILKTRIIVGEEVKTCQGEIIGLFLKEKIPPDMSMAETLNIIREQGGLVYLNHPFGYGQRSAQLCIEDLEGLWEQIDIIEVFNGRNMRRQGNRLAMKLARSRGKPGGVGTDAHSPWEVGRSYVRMANFDGPEDFLSALATAERTCRPCPFVYRVLFKLAKCFWYDLARRKSRH